MSNTSELIQGIRKAKAELLSNLLPQATITGADAAALVENRIVSKGERADGGKFSPYSTKGVAAFRYFGRSRNAAGERAVRDAAKKKQEVSYQDFRRLRTSSLRAKCGAVSVLRIFVLFPQALPK